MIANNKKSRALHGNARVGPPEPSPLCAQFTFGSRTSSTFRYRRLFFEEATSTGASLVSTTIWLGGLGRVGLVVQQGSLTARARLAIQSHFNKIQHVQD